MVKYGIYSFKRWSFDIIVILFYFFGIFIGIYNFDVNIYIFCLLYILDVYM